MRKKVINFIKLPFEKLWSTVEEVPIVLRRTWKQEATLQWLEVRARYLKTKLFAGIASSDSIILLYNILV